MARPAEVEANVKTVFNFELNCYIPRPWSSLLNPSSTGYFRIETDRFRIQGTFVAGLNFCTALPAKFRKVSCSTNCAKAIISGRISSRRSYQVWSYYDKAGTRDKIQAPLGEPSFQEGQRIRHRYGWNGLLQSQYRSPQIARIAEVSEHATYT